MHLDNRFDGKSFDRKINIDKTNYISQRKTLGFGDDSFDFDDALKSVNIGCVEFTNYFSKRKDLKFKIVKSEYMKLLSGTANLDDNYEMKVVNTEYNFNEIKLKLIYSETLGKNVHSLPLMYKLKYEKQPEIQFYVVNNDKKFKVCFIDIYHLAIPEKNQNVKVIYQQNCLNGYGLENLK